MYFAKPDRISLLFLVRNERKTVICIGNGNGDVDVDVDVGGRFKRMTEQVAAIKAGRSCVSSDAGAEVCSLLWLGSKSIKPAQQAKASLRSQ